MECYNNELEVGKTARGSHDFERRNSGVALYNLMKAAHDVGGISTSQPYYTIYVSLFRFLICQERLSVFQRKQDCQFVSEHLLLLVRIMVHSGCLQFPA